MNHRPDLFSNQSTLMKQSQRTLDDGLPKDPLDRLRLLCFSRGATGMLGLARSFRNMDDDGSKTINMDEFVTGMRDTGLDCSDAELQQMFQSFDTDGSGSINMTEFLMKLRPPMNQNRIDIINRAFKKMDTSGDGVITIDDLKHVYSVKEHPKYQTGEMTATEILKDYLKNFEGCGGNDDDVVTHEEFMNYYASVSASIDNDGYFDLMMRRSFKL